MNLLYLTNLTKTASRQVPFNFITTFNFLEEKKINDPFTETLTFLTYFTTLLKLCSKLFVILSIDYDKIQ